MSNEIAFPEGVAAYDVANINPSSLGLKSLCYDFNTEQKSWGKPIATTIRARYEPGNILVIFDNAYGTINPDEQAAFSERLNKTGILVARLINVAQILETLKGILPIIAEFEARLLGGIKLPDDNIHPYTEGLNDASKSVADSLADFSEISENTATISGYKLEKAAISEQLKGLGVKTIIFDDISRLSSFKIPLELK